MPLQEGLDEDVESLSKVLPVLEGSGSRTTTVDIPMLRRLYDAALEGRDLRRLMDALQEDDEFAVMERLSDRAGLTWACPIRSWRSGKGEVCEDCGKTEAQARLLADAARTFKVDPLRLLELADGPSDEDGWPIDAAGAHIQLTEGEHWAYQSLDGWDNPAGAGHAVEADRG